MRNLCFRGLTFMHGDRYTLTAGRCRTAARLGHARQGQCLVRLRGTENCRSSNVTLPTAAAVRSVWICTGSENKISGNHIEHMGGAGILLCGYGPGTKDVNKNNLVYNNHIHHMGRIYLAFARHHGLAERREPRGEQPDPPHALQRNDHFRLHDAISSTRNGRELGRTIRRHEVGDLPRNRSWKMFVPFFTHMTTRSSTTRSTTRWKRWATATESTFAAQVRGT